MNAVTAISIPQLRAVLNGRVIAPDDAGYDEARAVFYGGFDRRPAVIVRAAGATDVSHVVSLARETGVELAARSGGHSFFWAIRGGGGNFGVATRFQFRLHGVDTIVGGMLLLPATPGVASFVAEAEAAPEELPTIANVMPAPPMPFVPAEHHGRLVVTASAFEDEEGNPQLEVLNTVTFAEHNGKTKLTLQAVVVKSTPEVEEAPDGMEEGWSQSLDPSRRRAEIIKRRIT